MPHRPSSEPISQGKRQVGRSCRVASTSTCSRRDVLPSSSGFSREPTAPSTTPSIQHGHNRPESDCRQWPTQGPPSPAPAAASTGKSRRKRDYSALGKKMTPPSSGTPNLGNTASGVGSSEGPSKLRGHHRVSECSRAGDVPDFWEGPSFTDQKSTSGTAPLQICQVSGSDKAVANKTPQATQKRKMGSSVKGTSSENTSTANPSMLKKRRSEPSTGTTPKEPFDLSLLQVTFESRYTVGEILGKGGFGRVYAGTRKSDGLQVAIKLVARARAAEYITMPDSGVSLPLEVALMTIVSQPPECPNIVNLVEWFEGPLFFIFVLERPVPCMDLLNYCQRLPSRLSENQAKHIMRQVVLAAKHCRDRGVLHRDIKPENLLVKTDDVTVKLIDFGCGDLLTESPYNTFSGTKGYFPPEWWSQKSYQGRPTTVWSLGVLLYNLLCGKLPFVGEGEIVSGALQFSRGLSCECRNLIHLCLRKDPTKRPVLEEILQHKWFSTE